MNGEKGRKVGSSVRNGLSRGLSRKAGIVRHSQASKTRNGRIVAHRRKGSISRIVRIGMIEAIEVETAARVVIRTFVGTNVANSAGNLGRKLERAHGLTRGLSMKIMLRKVNRVRCGARMTICRRRARSTLLSCRPCRWWT